MVLDVQAEVSTHAFEGINCCNEGIDLYVTLSDVSSDTLFDVGRMRSELGLDQGANVA